MGRTESDRATRWLTGIALVGLLAFAVAGTVNYVLENEARRQDRATQSSVPDAPGEEPIAVSVGSDKSAFVCAGHISAYAERFFYPSSHPSPPPRSVRPRRCFDSPEEAKSAGYQIAAAPPGHRLVAGVYLVRPEARLRRECASAAKELGFAVLCPTWLQHTEFSALPVCRVGVGCARRTVFNVYGSPFSLDPLGPPGPVRLRMVTSRDKGAAPACRGASQTMSHVGPMDASRVICREPARQWVAVSWTAGEVHHRVIVRAQVVIRNRYEELLHSISRLATFVASEAELGPEQDAG